MSDHVNTIAHGDLIRCLSLAFPRMSTLIRTRLLPRWRTSPAGLVSDGGAT